MQRVDQHKRMLVHRVAVVRIANHQRIDPVKLRNQQLQHTQRMHRPQRIARMRPRQYLPADGATAPVPPPGAPTAAAAPATAAPPLPPQRRIPSAPSPQTPAAPHPDPAPDHVPARLVRVQHHPSCSTRNPCRSASAFRSRSQPQQLRRRLARRNLLHHLRHPPLHTPRMTEVKPHPVRRIRPSCGRALRSAPSIASAAASCACQSSVLSSRSCR